MRRIELQKTGAGALSRCRGFTLPEAMIASVISVVLFFILFGGIAFSRQMVASARYHSEAEALAMDQTLMMCNLTYSNLTSQIGVTTSNVPTNSLLFPLGGTLRTGVLNYTNYCQVQVRVDWRFVKWGVTNNPSESLWGNRYPTLRGGL